jgi:hypothetical protein
MSVRFEGADAGATIVAGAEPGETLGGDTLGQPALVLNYSEVFYIKGSPAQLVELIGKCLTALERIGICLYVRAWMPDYATDDPTYTCWFIGHHDEQALTDEALNAQFGAYFAQADTIDHTDGFQLWLEGHGYIAFHSAGDEGIYDAPINQTEEAHKEHGHG